MQQQLSFLKKILLMIGAIALVIFVSQWFSPNWGRLELGQPATITVTGQADEQYTNQIATFTAGVTVNDADREAAVNSANIQVEQLIKAVKGFGIPAEDIKTENINVYEYDQPNEEPMFFPAGIKQSEPANNGQTEKIWQASNTLTITLRDVSQASELATILTNTGATTISGPNFTTDDTTAMDRQLLQAAVTDAREKAVLLLAGTGQHITRIINIYENGGYTPYPRYQGEMMLDSGTTIPVEPGSTNIYKSVSVVFEISR